MPHAAPTFSFAIALGLFATSARAAPADAGAPFGSLELVDEIVTGDQADLHPVFEDPAGATKVATILGQPARVMTMGDAAKVFAYKIGAGKGLVAGQAYLLAIDYPEDTSRQIVVINRGADFTRTFSTGQTIGDSRESYTYPAPESLKIPLSGKWETIRSLFFLHERFQGVKGARNSSDLVYPDKPSDGFWVVIGQFRKKDSPIDAGAAVARIRLFAVPKPEEFDLTIHYPPADMPRRHIFWREEMADGAVGSSDPAQRAFSKSVDWYDAKMRLAKFLGVNTFAKDLLEFGYTQNWDTSPHGGNEWFYNANQPTLWSEILDRAAAHGMDVLPYYEYAGAMGEGKDGVLSYGKQRHCRPLSDRAGNAISDVSWSEIACIDVSDPAAKEDVKNLLDATIGRYKSKVSFVGAWFRTRSSNWPVSFADETLARFGAEAASGTAPTRAALQADPGLLQQYYAWWFGKRRDYLVTIRDWLQANVSAETAVLFTSYIQESLRVPSIADWMTPTDDLATLTQVNSTDPWKWRFAPTDFSKYVSDGKFLEMTLRMTPPTASGLENHAAEPDHSAPPADPSRYKETDGVYMTMPFSRLFTVSSAEPFDAFRAKSGLALVRHFNLNEEDGQNPDASEGPMSKKVGYFVTDVDRAGPYSMLTEARAVAFGDPRFIGYLSSSSFSRGFPEYTRAFNAAFLALPALPSTMVAGASADPEVVVRAIPTAQYGSYYAVVNTGLLDKKDVAITLASTGTVTDLVSGNTVPRSGEVVRLSFFPGQLYALNVSTVPVVGDGGILGGGEVGTRSDSGGIVRAEVGAANDASGGAVDSSILDGSRGDVATAEPSVPIGGQGQGSSSGCGCHAGRSGDAMRGSIALTLLALVQLRRRRGHAQTPRRQWHQSSSTT